MSNTRPSEDTNENGFPAQEWLNENAPLDLVLRVENQIASEKKERLIRNVGSNIDYGFSFPSLDEIRQFCLNEIRHFNTDNQIRPVVADLGAGFGSMTWKMLAAGAQVDAFEIQTPSATELNRRLQQMNASYWEGSKLNEILKVYPENILTALKRPEFFEKYDFIWLGSVVHFLTPDDLNALNALLLQVLKPNGKVIIESNSIGSFADFPNFDLIKGAYARAKQKEIEFPGFLAINAATLIDHTIDKVVAFTVVSALDTHEMRLHAIPYQTQAYAFGYLAPNAETTTNEKKFRSETQTASGHEIRLNRFYQVMHLLEEDVALKTYTMAGFSHVDSFYCSSKSGRRITSENKSGHVAYALVVKKPRTDLLSLSFLNQTPDRKILLETYELCGEHKNYVGYIKAIKERDYSLALRRACAIGSQPLINLIFKYQLALDIDINKKSQSNGWTALDWLENAKDVDPEAKKVIVENLLTRGAKRGAEDGAKPSVIALHK